MINSMVDACAERDYAIPRNEEMHFCSSEKKRKKGGFKVVIFRKSRRIFFNIKLMSEEALMLAISSNVSMIHLGDKTAIFVDIDWLIDNAVDGADSLFHLLRLKKELLLNKTLQWNKYD